MILLAGSSPVSPSGVLDGGGIVLVAPGSCRPLAPAGSVSWLTRHPVLPVVYSLGREAGGRDADAATGLAAQGRSEIRAWRVQGSPEAPALAPLGAVGLEGDGPCHMVVAGGALYVAYYTGGEVGRLLIGDDGRVVAGSESRVSFSGTGPDPHRQESSHPHHVLVSAAGEVVVTDLGADLIRILDPVSLATIDEVALAAGCGPRHSVETAPGVFAVAGELDETVSVARRGGVASVPSTGRRAATRNYPSDIRALPGDRVVVANRGADSLAVCAVGPDPAGPIVEWDAGGAWPQALAVSTDVDADVIAVALRDTDRVAFHRLRGDDVEALGHVDLARPQTLLDIAVLWDRALPSTPEKGPFT